MGQPTTKIEDIVQLAQEMLALVAERRAAREEAERRAAERNDERKAA